MKYMHLDNYDQWKRTENNPNVAEEAKQLRENEGTRIWQLKSKNIENKRPWNKMSKHVV